MTEELGQTILPGEPDSHSILSEVMVRWGARAQPLDCEAVAGL